MAEALVLMILGKIGSILGDEAVKSLVELFKKEVVVVLEAEEKLKHIASEFRVMSAFLSQGEGREQNTSSEAWLKELRVVAREVEDVVDEYAYLADEYHNRSYVERILHKTKSVKSLHSIATRLKEIEVSLQKLSEMKPRYDISFPGESTSTISESQQELAISSYLMSSEEPIGLEPQKEKLVTWLTNGNSDHSIVTIWGMGGLGKTTLAHNVFNSQVIKQYFDCYIWVSVSQKYDVDALLRGIIKDIFYGAKVPEGIEKMNRSDLVLIVKNTLECKRYLLILDDVWSPDLWFCLGSAFVESCHGSRIVITTRNEGVAAFGGEYVLKLKCLGEKEAWDLFCRRAFKNEKRCPEALKEWARKIVAKCQGLPLALVAIGSLLSHRPKNDIEWRRFYNQFNWELSNNVNANELNWVKKVINLSYNYLPSYLKSCFLYCSMFPEDYLIKRKRLIRLWVSEGFISVEGREQLTLEELSEVYLNELIQRSMLQVETRNSFGRVKDCRMHDIVRELAVAISCKQEFSMVFDNLDASRLHERARRLSIHAYKDVLSGVNLSSLRTFIVLDTVLEVKNMAISSFKYLRVLDLKYFGISILPDSVTDLFNLHHLDLSWTLISELPKLIGRLKNLQVLDLIYTDIKKFPPGLTKLKNLRYLSLPTELEFSEDLCALKDLQTLKFNAIKQKSVGWIGNLTQLRCLHIHNIDAHRAELWASIANLCFLSNLKIRLLGFVENRFMFKDTDVTLQHLQKLSISGISDAVVPSLFRFCGSSLQELDLTFSQLDEDPLLSLSYLSNLTSLQLGSACHGHHQLCFKARWFPRLKILHLVFQPELNLLEIEDGALQSLEVLHLRKLGALLVVPDGIKFLTSLKEIQLENMADEFIERIKGEDHRKVEHVPTIRVWDDRVGTLANLQNRG